MKIRVGFVSNSSSSSFLILAKTLLNKKQIKRIQKGIEDYKKDPKEYFDEDEGWICEEKHYFGFIQGVWYFRNILEELNIPEEYCFVAEGRYDG